MTPKEKAQELIEKFRDENNMFEADTIAAAKWMAEICVDEIIELDVTWNSQELIKDYPSQGKEDSTYEFWESVKEELSLL